LMTPTWDNIGTIDNRMNFDFCKSYFKCLTSIICSMMRHVKWQLSFNFCQSDVDLLVILL
jgi:hypothetical protein